MKFLVYVCFSLIFYIDFLTKAESRLIITYHDQKTIGNYFIALKHYTQNQIGIFSEEGLKYYCHILRLSKLLCQFTTGSQQDTSELIPTSHSGIFNLTIKKIKIEQKQFKSEFPKISQQIKRTEKLQKLSTITCFDRNGIDKWFVTPAFMPNSAFLYKINPNYHFVSSREITTQHKAYPQLMAILDDNALRIASASAPKELFHKSLYYLDRFLELTSNVSRDPLCNLKPIMKYRLCALAIDALQFPEIYRSTDTVPSSNDNNNDNDNDATQDKEDDSGGDDDNEYYDDDDDDDDDDNDDDDNDDDDDDDDDDDNGDSDNDYYDLYNEYKNERLATSNNIRLPPPNIYYPLDDPDVSCQRPHINISPDTRIVPQKLLHCSIHLDAHSVVQPILDFHLGQHPTDSERVFIFFNKQLHNPTIVEELKVPLLRHVFQYRRLFYDDDDDDDITHNNN